MQTEIVSLPNVLPYVVIGTIGFVLAIILTVWVRRTLRRWRFGADRESVTKHWQAVEDLAARGDAMARA